VLFKSFAPRSFRSSAVVPGGAANQWRCAFIMIDILKRAWIAVSIARIWYAGSGLPSHQPRLESNMN